MKRSAMFTLGMLAIISMLVLSACIPQPATRPPTITPRPTVDPSASNGGETTGDTPAPEATEEETMPADLVIMDGAYDLNIARDFTQIIFKVDQPTENVVAYYQEQLPALGWTNQLQPDTAVGSMALMIRENDNGDRVSVNMQFNPNAQFTVVTLVTARDQ